jgi:lipopolysaccharide/colanic/teichoic acid biosynthesis glycosyltransferase
MNKFLPLRHEKPTLKKFFIKGEINAEESKVDGLNLKFQESLLKYASNCSWEALNRSEILMSSVLNSNKHLFLNGLLVKAYVPNLIFQHAFKLIDKNQYFSFLVETAENIKSERKRQLSNFGFKIYYPFHFILHRVLPKLKGFRKVCRLLEISVDMSKSEIIGRLIYEGFEIENVTETSESTLFIASKNCNIEAVPSSFAPPSKEGFLFTMKRLGKENRLIKTYKFRTMHPYAEYVQAYVYNQNGLEKSGKFKNDFRVSTGGRVIRKYWIDELPMLINWMKGDIKLVGVRPISTHYFNLYPQELKELRGKHKPGLLPPYYADMPSTFDEIVNSEIKYIRAYEQNPWKTDLDYLGRILTNIIFKKARSK